MLAGVSSIAPVSAQIEELRIGTADNIRFDHNRHIVEGKEEGANIEIEVAFKSPEIFGRMWSPRPYLMASINTDHTVSFAGVGLLWRWQVSERWAIEPGLGYVIHDGQLNNTDAADPNAFEADHQLLGSRDLFRVSMAIEFDFAQQEAVQVFWEHLSHGQILGTGRNQGLEYIGARFLHRFGRTSPAVAP